MGWLAFLVKCALMDGPLTAWSSGAVCAHHSHAAAVAICSRCGSYTCSQCHRLGADGKDYCFECDQRVPDLADRGERFVANLVDNFIIFIPLMGGAFLQAVLSDRGATSGIAILLGVIGTLGVLGYQGYLAQSGQSIGKRWRHLRVVRTDGSPASLARILLLRNVIPAAIGSFCGLFGLIDALLIFGEERRCLHDLLADTKVITEKPGTDHG